ncbi:sugar porter family MFS transporter [Flavitalea antarctica]
MKNAFLIGFAVSLGGLMFGFDVGIIGGAIPFLEQHFKLNEWEVGWSASSLLLGAVLGAAMAGKLADNWGRRKVLLYIALLFGVTSLSTGLAPNFSLFIIFRFLGGVSVGAVSVLSPMYLSESAPSGQRGKIVSLYQLAITIGIVLSYLVSYLLHDIGSWNWRWMFISGVVPSIAFWCLLLYVPESPRWLLLKGRTVEAKGIIEKLYGKEGGKAALAKLLGGEREKAVRNLNWKDGAEKKLLLAGITLAILVQLSGVNTVVDYAPRILQSAGWQIDAALFSTFGIGICFVLFTLLGVAIIDRVGRKFLYLFGSAGMTSSLGALTYMQFTNQFEGTKVLVLLLVYVAFFATCIGTAFWTLVAEIFPNAIRGKAMSLSALTNWSANFLVVFLFPWLVSTIGGGGTFAFLTLMSGAQLVFSFIFLTETKGKSLEEIRFAGH